MEIDFGEIVVATVGRETESDEIGQTFAFQSKTYEILLQEPDFDKLSSKFDLAGLISFR